jgi:L-malate glycosyltransferase
MRLADVVVCNGHAVRDTLIGARRMKARVTVVPNGVDVDHFRPLPAQRRSERARLGFGDHDFVFGAVSNVRPVKNYALLLRTMQRLAQRFPQVRLVCVGGGPQLREMQSLAQELGIASRVTWTGQVTDIRPYVATFDAYVLTSLKEGCPNSLMQAMAMGVASASARVGEVDYLTDRGRCALVFDVQQPDQCFAACSQLVTDDALRARLAAAGRERMRDAYAHGRMLNEYMDLYRETAAVAR